MTPSPDVPSSAGQSEKGLVERLRWHTTDWDGSKMIPGEPARGDVPCRLIDEAAERVEQLERQVASAERAAVDLSAERLNARAAALRAGFHGGNLAEIIDNMREQLAAAKRDGWVLVPKEPTETMVRTGAIGICNEARGCEGQYRDDDSVWSTWQRDARYAYSAMVSAAMQSDSAKEKAK